MNVLTENSWINWWDLPPHTFKMIDLNEAQAMADKIIRQLEPFCSRAEVAGSIRRQVDVVKDIEICCTPQLDITTDLFGGGAISRRVAGFGRALIALGDIMMGKIADGRFIKIALPGDMILDLFVPQEDDYYRQLAIRTGSLNYSHKVLAHAWLKKGWCGTREGLRLQRESIVRKMPSGKEEWTCYSENPTLPPVWKTEQDFFTWLRLKWVPPEERNL